MARNRNSCIERIISSGFLFVLLALGDVQWAESSERGRVNSDQNTDVAAPEKPAPGSTKTSGAVRDSHLDVLTRRVALVTDPPELCAGHGEFNSISVTDWEAGLGTWSVGTHDVFNPDTFDTPDWAAVGSLPDSRTGMAAFVADLDTGDCIDDDESGALTLDSAPIFIPVGTMVPRVSVDHWVETELEYDGGNIKISVNGGAFTLIPKSAIDYNPYNGTLVSVSIGNTNPLAGEDVFTGANDRLGDSWWQSHINLFGIATAGDMIRLRFDFGVDGCDGLIGWYVDDVKFYSCSAELPPSDCGNGVMDEGEQCDDGNTFIDDGCTNTCQIDQGWQCTVAIPPGNVPDHSFEAGTPNPSWTEASTNFGSPICNVETCGMGTGTGPSDGSFWAWFGGAKNYEEASLSQMVVIPAGADELQFELEVSACDSPSDYLELLIDSSQELVINGSSPQCGKTGYTNQSVDISAYADGAPHILEFHSESFAVNLDLSNFFVDDVGIPGKPSVCSRLTGDVIFEDGFE